MGRTVWRWRVGACRIAAVASSFTSSTAVGAGPSAGETSALPGRLVSTCDDENRGVSPDAGCEVGKGVSLIAS